MPKIDTALNFFKTEQLPTTEGELQMWALTSKDGAIRTFPTKEAAHYAREMMVEGFRLGRKYTENQVKKVLGED